MEFRLANSTVQGSAAGARAPEDPDIGALVHTKVGTSTLETLVDTGAKTSCVGDYFMIADPFCKNLVVRKCSRKAFAVNGSPVVTMGLVDIEFKLGGASYTHTFTILRGLINPMLLGRDFLGKFKANICFDGNWG